MLRTDAFVSSPGCHLATESVRHLSMGGRTVYRLSRASRRMRGAPFPLRPDMGGISVKRDCRVVKTSEVLASGNLMRRRPGHRGSTVSRRPALRGSTVFAHENRPHSRHMRRRTVLGGTAAAAGGPTYAHTWSATPRRASGGPLHPATSHRHTGRTRRPSGRRDGRYAAASSVGRRLPQRRRSPMPRAKARRSPRRRARKER